MAGDREMLVFFSVSSQRVQEEQETQSWGRIGLLTTFDSWAHTEPALCRAVS